MAFNVQILTPEKVVMEAEADSVVVPAFEGELGILPNHTPLLARLHPGEIRMRKGESVMHFAVSDGFVEVRSGGAVSVFAETAEMAREIDVERARQAAERARTALRTAKGDMDLLQVEAALKRALARLKAYESIRHKHPTSK